MCILRFRNPYCAIQKYPKQLIMNDAFYERHSCFGLSFSRLSSIKSQPASKKIIPKTYYELFPKTLPEGPPPSGPFKIDTRALRREFLQLQALAHPDRHAETSKQAAEYESAYINEAFVTLQRPLSRAQYLLSLRDNDLKEDDASAMTELGSNLLVDVMETREAIEAAAVANSKKALQRIKIENDHRIEKTLSLLSDAFECNDWQKAKNQTIRLKYWMSIKDSIDELEDA